MPTPAFSRSLLRRQFRLAASLLFCLLPTLCAWAGTVEPAGFLFVTFTGEQSAAGEQIYFALSRDGLQWEGLNGNQPVLTSALGEKGARDPYLLRGENGKFYLLATDLSIFHNHGWQRAVRAGSRSLLIWESDDLVKWTEPRLMEVAPPDAGCTWAPEAIYDAASRRYLVYWASTSARDDFQKQRILAVWTEDFRHFSEPFVYIEKPTTIIDTDIVHGKDGRYYRFTKDEKFKAITMETSDRVTGTWAEVPGFSLAQAKGFEGPTCFQVKAGEAGRPATWCLLLDAYARKLGYQPFLTTDLASGNFQAASGFHFPFRFRHGSALSLSTAEYERVKAAWSPAVAPVATPATAPAPPAPPTPPTPAPATTPESAATPPRPILEGYTADPALRVFGDTYYLYPTSDKGEWLTTDFSVWSSKNLVDWQKRGMVLDVAHDLSWAKIRAWAPDCVERDGTWFFYFCAEGKIGVATASSPVGPFRDALGKPLLARQGKDDPRITSNTIDPYPFIDEDGQTYLYWGNSSGRVNVVELKRDMITLDGEPQEFLIQGRSSGVTVNFREGIVVFRRGGKYYFMWSVDDARSDDYRVAYGTAEGPLGPVHLPEEATVLQKHGPAKGTGHHSVVQVPGTDRWYVAYHRHAIPHGNGYTREVCLARMEFRPDGTIRPMDPMVQAFQPGDRGEPILEGRGLPGN